MLNPALAALLKTAQMATPQGTPTVAQGIAKLALAKEMPQAAPPALPEVAENVQAALPTMERNAQQAQMEQIANMVAQRMSPENSGIAQLPVGGGEYAEGGVVGYNGQEESFIDRLPKESGLRRLRDWIVSGRPQPLEKPLLEALLPGAAPEVARSTTDTGDETARVAARRAAPVRPTTAQAIEAQVNTAPGTSYQPDSSLFRSSVRPSGAAAAAAAPASAVGAPATGEDPYKGLKALAGRGEFAQPEPTMRGQIALLNEARLARGLTGGVGEGLEKLVQDLRAEQARLGTEREKSLKGRPLENLIQSFAAARTGGLGGLGRTYANLQSAQRAEQERFNALQYERKIALAKMDADKEAMREAAARGDKEGYDKALSDHRATARDYNKLTAEAQMNLARFAGEDRRAAEDRASRERMEALQRSTQLQIAKIQAAARTDPASREAMAVARVQAAINGSPMLKALAEKAKFDATAATQYAAEERRLYLTLAPELLIGAEGGGSAPSARSAADAILQGTK